MGSPMKMSDYEIDLDSMEYGDEIMSAGWNPDVDLICQGVSQVLQVIPVTTESAMPADGVVSEMFLRRMYSYHH